MHTSAFHKKEKLKTTNFPGEVPLYALKNAQTTKRTPFAIELLRMLSESKARYSENIDYGRYSSVTPIIAYSETRRYATRKGFQHTHYK